MINKKLLAFTLAGAFLLVGCSTKEVHQNQLVQNKQLLKQSPLDENVLYFKNPGFDVKNYNRLYVKNISVIKNESSQNVNEELLKQVTDYLQLNLENRLSNVLKNNEGRETLKMEIAISNIDVSYKDLAFYQYLPYGLAFTALKRGTGFEQRQLNIQLVLKLSNLRNGNTEILLVDNSKPKETKDYSALTFENVKPQLDAWISKYELRLHELNEGKYKNYKQ